MSNSLVETATSIPDWMVVTLGFGMVFIGLVIIILLCVIIGVILSTNKKTDEATASTTSNAVATTPAANAEIPNRQEFVAAVSAAIAEEMGTDVSAIRIISIEKV